MKQRVRFPGRQDLDRISYLPEGLQNHIVSFLPLEDAVRTSILSRPWRHICSSLTNLDFSQLFCKKIYMKNVSYKNTVKCLLNLHGESDIDKFNFFVNVDDSLLGIYDIEPWTAFAVKHHVRELSVTTYLGDPEKLPSCVFTCHTLSELSLTNIMLIFPTVVGFPILKSLILQSVCFRDEDLTTKFFCNCPMLKHLIISRCNMLSLHSLAIFLPKLKTLTLSDAFVAHPIDIHICAPNLQEIVYRACKPPNISSQTLSSLVAAFFSFYLLSDVTSVSRVLMGLKNVVRLDLASPPTFPSFGVWAGKQKAEKQVELFICTSESRFYIAAFVLSNYPELETLCICFKRKSRYHQVYRDEFLLQIQKLNAGSMLKHLRTVEVKLMEGNDNELELVRYLLENATFLEKLNVSYPPEKQVNDGRALKIAEISDKFKTLAAMAPLVEISFSDSTYDPTTLDVRDFKAGFKASSRFMSY